MGNQRKRLRQELVAGRRQADELYREIDELAQQAASTFRQGGTVESQVTANMLDQLRLIHSSIHILDQRIRSLEDQAAGY